MHLIYYLYAVFSVYFKRIGKNRVKHVTPYLMNQRYAWYVEHSFVCEANVVNAKIHVNV
jgi:hypothetical protein